MPVPKGRGPTVRLALAVQSPDSQHVHLREQRDVASDGMDCMLSLSLSPSLFGCYFHPFLICRGGGKLHLRQGVQFKIVQGNRYFRLISDLAMRRPPGQSGVPSLLAAPLLGGVLIGTCAAASSHLKPLRTRGLDES